jgi:hypothetical protein
MVERLPAGSITSWDDLTSRFLTQFFPPERTKKLRNDILMFQQRQGETLYEAWTHFKDLLQKVLHHGIDLWLQIQIFYDHVYYHTKRTIDRAVGGRLRDKDAKKSWEIIDELAFYDDELWETAHVVNSAVKAISSPENSIQLSEESLCELEKRFDYVIEKQKRPLSPRRAAVNSIVNDHEINGIYESCYVN